MSQRHDQNGFTILEVSIVSLVLGILSLMVVQSLRGLSATQAFAEGQSKLSSLAQRTMQKLLRDTTFAVRVFPHASASSPTLASMDPATLWSISGSRLPVPQSLGYFEPDGVGPIETGNSLFMACALKPAVVELSNGPVVWKVRVDRFRFVSWFLTEGCDDLFDLNRWASVPLARFLDVASIVDQEQRRQTCLRLRQEGVLFTWDPEEEGAGAFRWISESGLLVLLGEAAAPTVIPLDGEQGRFGIFAKNRVGVAPNGFLKQAPTPFYAEPQAGFPHGFEVKVDGSTAGSLLLVRLVLTTNRPGRIRNFAEVRRLTTIRER